MRRARFLIVIARRGAVSANRRAMLGARSTALEHFTPIWSGDRAIMLVEGPHLAIERGGVAGWVHRRGTPDPIGAMSSADAALVHATAGQYLIDAHWGGYVALIERENDALVLRAPLGDLACLITQTEDEILIASDVALLAIAGQPPTVAFDAVARFLASPDLRQAETCLAGITELQGGLRMSVGAGETTIEECWTPWKFAARERQFETRDEAAHRLRDVIFHATEASCRHHGPVILRLSGGLDSSIVAASLARTGLVTTALTLTTDDPAGDERRYARLVASYAGFRLEERSRQLADVDLAIPAAAGQPRPTARAFGQAAIAPATSLAAETGAGALIDGGGGDNVFCSLQSIRPVVDAMVSGERWSCTRDIARSLATVSQVSQATVLQRAVFARWKRISCYSFPLDVRFLSGSGVQAAQGSGEHIWLNAPPGALPGKAAHIAIIAAAQSVVESFDPMSQLPLVSPLITQPVIEACIRIPSWWWYERGLNRAVARNAFAEFLPAAIIERRSKGGLDSFIAELFQHHRSSIAACLLDGVLVEHGLLDRAALAAALSEQGPVQNIDFMRIMRLIDVEVWARSY